METEARSVEAPIKRRRFTDEEFHKMAEAGIIHEDDRLELIEGEIVEMAAIGSRHLACVNGLTHLLVRAVGDETVVSVQNPVRLNGGLEPQPDLAVLRVRDYRESLPGPEDVLLLIEVSDTTLRYDREVKLPLYARAGVREAWIVDLPGETIERHADPAGDGYRRTEKARWGEKLRSEAVPDLVLRTGDILGRS